MTEEEFCALGKLSCSSLSVFLRSEGLLQSLKPVEFQIKENAASIDVLIQQNGVREISLTASRNMPLATLWSCFETIEQLLMLFDGRFYTIEKASFSCDGLSEEARVSFDMYAEERLRRRLPFYNSGSICKNSCMKLLSYADLVDSALFENWLKLKTELDIIHPSFLYCLADTGVPVDLKCAHIIEVFEPLVELIAKYNNFFPLLSADSRSPTLRICLDSIISHFGQAIFDREFNFNKENCLKLLVSSRVRIMHIKSMQNGKYLDGEECILYLAKFSLLYRCVLFSLLGIKHSLFEGQLKNAVDQWNSWAESCGADTLWASESR